MIEQCTCVAQHLRSLNPIRTRLQPSTATCIAVVGIHGWIPALALSRRALCHTATLILPARRGTQLHVSRNDILQRNIARKSFAACQSLHGKHFLLIVQQVQHSDTVDILQRSHAATTDIHSSKIKLHSCAVNLTALLRNSPRLLRTQRF